MTVFQYLAKIAYIDLTKKFSFFFIATHKKIDYNLLPILLYLYHTVGMLFKKSLKLVTMPRIFFMLQMFQIQKVHRNFARQACFDSSNIRKALSG